MHLAAFKHALTCLNLFGPWESVVEIGSLNINGQLRGLLGRARYVGVDVRPGRGVDVVADGATWQPDQQVDAVLCLETLEHAGTYVVDDIRIVAPTDVSVLRPTTESVITLVTCYPFYFVGSAPKRYVVRARKVLTQNAVGR